MGWAGIARFGGVGDNLIAASVLRPLQRLGYQVEMITSGPAAVVYQNNPAIAKLTIKREGDVPGGPEGWAWFAARGSEYETFTHLSYTCEGRHALRKDNPMFWWRPDYRRQLCGGSYLETVHDIVGVAHDFGPLYFPTEEELARARRTRDEQIQGRYVAWVISGSRIDKIYPYAAMAIARIIRELDVAVVMIGIGGEQSEMAAQIADHVKRQNGSQDRLHIAITSMVADPGGAQDWPLRRSLAQAYAADLVVTPDTGVAWAVAMEPTPKIVMLSHASAANITKHWTNTMTLHADPDRVPCWPCHRLHDDMSTCVPAKDLGKAAACIADISVELILTAAKAALGSQSSGKGKLPFPAS